MDTTISAQYFATLDGSKVATICEAIPPATELRDCQIILSKEEYELLRLFDGKAERAFQVIKAIRAKIKANVEANNEANS